MSIKHIVRENIILRYKFEKTLGEGAFSKVKIASLHSDPSRKFAIKSIPRHLMDVCCGEKDKDAPSNADLDINEQVMQELLNSEIQIVLEMDHPNIVKFYQCVYDNTYINIVMELVKGTTLSDYLLDQKNNKIPEAECKIILRQAMHAIKYFHGKGIVHRDLKLDNILI